jgi:hypothetical protein
VKVGDLVYDDHYGHGLVIGEDDGDYMIRFYELSATAWVEKENVLLLDSIEVISESR